MKKQMRLEKKDRLETRFDFETIYLSDLIKILENLSEKYSTYKRLCFEANYGYENDISWDLMGIRDETDVEMEARIKVEQCYLLLRKKRIIDEAKGLGITGGDLV